MNQKGFVNIVLIILIVIVAGATGYFVFNKKAESPSQIPEEKALPIKTIPKDTGSEKSGIKGIVYGQGCNGASPVILPDESTTGSGCSTNPYSNFKLLIINTISKVEKEIITDSAGKFNLDLVIGTYTIKSPTFSNDNLALKCPTKIVEVKKNILSDITFTCLEFRP